MDQKHILKQLKLFGLTKYQAVIYLGILETKRTTVLELARATKISRPTIYDNIVELKSLGLIEQVKERSKTFLVPTSPENIYKVINKKQTVAKALLPSLEAIYTTDEIKAPAVKFFSGAEGFKKLTNQILESEEKVIRTIADYEANIKGPFSKKFLHNFWKMRERRNIKAKILYTTNSVEKISELEEYKSTGNIRYGRKVRILPEEIDLQVHYTIVDDTVLFWSLKEEDISFQFNSNAYAESLKSLFDYLWEQSEPFNS